MDIGILFFPVCMIVLFILFPSMTTATICTGGMFLYFDTFMPHKRIRHYICLLLGMLLLMVGIVASFFPSKTYFMYKKFLPVGVMLLVAFLGICIIEFSIKDKIYNPTKAKIWFLRISGGTVAILSIVLAVLYVYMMNLVEILYFGESIKFIN